MAILLDVACSSARIQQRVRSSECGRLHAHAGGVLHAKFSIRLRPLPGKRDLQCSILKRIGPSPRLRHCTERKDISKSTPSSTNLTPIIGSRNTCSPTPADNRQTTSMACEPSRPSLWTNRHRSEEEHMHI